MSIWTAPWVIILVFDLFKDLQRQCFDFWRYSILDVADVVEKLIEIDLSKEKTSIHLYLFDFFLFEVVDICFLWRCILVK